MITKIITAEQYADGIVRLPKSGTFLEASNDGHNWVKRYFVQLSPDSKRPFICVDIKKNIHFPATKGNLYAYIKIDTYEVDDIVMNDDKLVTRDGLYETYKDKNSGNYYWQRTNFAQSQGIEEMWYLKWIDKVYMSVESIEQSVNLLNKLTK